MAEYRVTYVIDVEAATPEAAAGLATDSMRDLEVPPLLSVLDLGTGDEVEIDTEKL